MKEFIKRRIQDSVDIKNSIMQNDEILSIIECLANEIVKALKNGNKIVLCGNGGSASDALHFAGEIVGRFQKERSAWPAVVLNSDDATMTTIANDYGFDEIYARQAEAHVKYGDVFLGISTSGNSENVIKAVKAAKSRDGITAALLGNNGGKIKEIVDYPIIVPCNITARIQECHILLIHILCEIIEEKIK